MQEGGNGKGYSLVCAWLRRVITRADAPCWRTFGSWDPGKRRVSLLPSPVAQSARAREREQAQRE